MRGSLDQQSVSGDPHSSPSPWLLGHLPRPEISLELPILVRIWPTRPTRLQRYFTIVDVAVAVSICAKVLTSCSKSRKKPKKFWGGWLERRPSTMSPTRSQTESKIRTVVRIRTAVLSWACFTVSPRVPVSTRSPVLPRWYCFCATMSLARSNH
jgi:hypothetical protein